MTKTDFIFGITPGDIIYDIETFPNVFTLTAIHAQTGTIWVFEFSFRCNHTQLLCLFLDVLREQGCRMVGFNNIGFDYPVIHYIYQYRNSFITVDDIYQKAMSIIRAPDNARFSHLIWESDRLVEQIDLFKIYHFDNRSKTTSLKILEFNMRMNNIEDLPFDVGTHLDSDQIDVLLKYNHHDDVATKMFYERADAAIRMRENLSASFDTNMMNMSDVKIGEVLLVTEMEKQGISCYYHDGKRKQKKQTIRESVDLNQVIFDYISFERPEFNVILNYFRSKVITETKGVFKDLIAHVDGIDYVFGTGGLHASVDNKIIESTDTMQIIDVDVASFYPNMGIKNKLYPAHLGEAFCDAYLSLYHTRKTFPKGSPENEAYKLALNGAYGGSNNKYSPFFDTFYTMSITINGQLMLCMLAEQLLKTPGLKMIQCNTDGVTYLCPREYIDHTRAICRWWEQLTQLELEEALYSRMFIRDVNSYIAEKEDGKLKRIGAYAHVTAEDDPGTRELPYHKDWSARIVPLAAEAALVRGEDIRTFIENHGDIFDFFLRTKVPRSSILEHGGEQVPNIIRYYVSTDGDFLEKVSPPKGPEGEFKRANKLTDAYFAQIMSEIGPGVWDERIHTKNKSIYETRYTGIHTGWTVSICNSLPEIIADPDYIDRNGCDGGDIADYEAWRNDINYDWYVQEAEKLVTCML